MRKKLMIFCLFFEIVLMICSCGHEDPIDRYALVHRHNVIITKADPLNSLSVGNGNFAFTVGVTGLQSFPGYYEKGISLGTESNWGWHSFPNDSNYTIKDVTKYYPSCNGRKVPYDVAFSKGRKGRASNYLRANPQRLHLGLIGLELYGKDGKRVTIDDIKNIHQKLDLWQGKIDSRYEVNGLPVHVELYCSQQTDVIAFKITSPLIAQQKLKVFLHFPYANPDKTSTGYDFSHPDQYQTKIIDQKEHSAILQEKIDTTVYYINASWNNNAGIKEKKSHYYVISPAKEDSVFSCIIAFSPKKSVNSSPDFQAVQANSKQQWKKYWTTGGVIDFSACTDPRAMELERRVVLSQYLTRIQCAGNLPPQETGLTYNSWYGKFHLEMHWWHVVHFALWDHLDLLNRSLDWYKKIYNKAKATAQWQGYEGVRWPKMTGPNGNKGPSSVGELLIWQEPHIIYFAELNYRQHPDKATLERFKKMVFSTADFMASFATYDPSDKKYHLCPPLIPAQELFKADSTWDPPFELAYWHYALSVAQQWRKRLGLSTNKKWQEVIDHLAPFPVKDSLYLPSATVPDAYTNDFYRHDHPIVLGAYGILPSEKIMNKAIMNNTFDEVMKRWDWSSTWGWDYPMIAMAAARLGRPKDAIDALFMDVQKNTYLPNGHNYQDQRLRIYLPGNGALLTAVAMMATGWDGASDIKNPGFPHNGKWNIKWEGLQKMP